MHLGYIDLSHKDEWENLVKHNPASGYMQSFLWTDFLRTLGWETYKIGLFENNKIIGGAIIGKYSHFKKYNLLAIPEGPVLPYDKPETESLFHTLISEIDTVADLTGKKRTSHLTIEPKLTRKPPYFSRFRKAPFDQQPIRTIMLNLHLSEAELLQQMKPKGRYNIKIAQKHDVNVIESDLQLGLADFLSLYRRLSERNSFMRKDDGYFVSLINIFKKSGLLHLYFGKFHDTILAAALVLYFGNTATYLFGASSELYPEVMAAYLLQWEIIRQFKLKGLSWYDLYSLAPGNNPQAHPWWGYTVFKRKFGGNQIDYIGGYDFVYNQALYEDFLRENQE
jgi:peptidoglycan pentaglycine glycine transferase (the first glycine)